MGYDSTRWRRRYQNGLHTADKSDSTPYMSFHSTDLEIGLSAGLLVALPRGYSGKTNPCRVLWFSVDLSWCILQMQMLKLELETEHLLSWCRNCFCWSLIWLVRSILSVCTRASICHWGGAQAGRSMIAKRLMIIKRSIVASSLIIAKCLNS